MTTLSTPRALPTAARTAPGWLPLAALLSGTFLVVLDFFIVNVALPSIQRDLGAGDSAVEWLVAGYGLTFGGLLMAAGPLSQRWGAGAAPTSSACSSSCSRPRCAGSRPTWGR